MKKLVSILMTGVFALSLVSLTFAQDAPKTKKDASAAKADKKAAKKAKKSSKKDKSADKKSGM
jgi:hypothetical protein